MPYLIYNGQIVTTDGSYLTMPTPPAPGGIGTMEIGSTFEVS